MSARYNIVVTKHPLDGLLLSFNQIKDSDPGELIISVSGGEGTAVACGYTIPSTFMGLTGLLFFKPETHIVKVTYQKRFFQVVFSTSQPHNVQGNAELLDHLREVLKDFSQVTLIIEYSRLEADMPPLSSDDKVICFWETRDLLTDSNRAHFQYLTERIENEGPKFQGLHFYKRTDGTTTETNSRLKEIQELVPTGTPPWPLPNSGALC
jgi:hypothetical protein